jgi:hypothetical protein
MEMDFPQEVCQRLPLADAVLRLGQFVLSDNHVKDIFNQHRGRSYQKVITFPVFVNLIGDALLEHNGSGHQAFTRALDEGKLETSMQAVYGKLQRIPISLSTGFLSDTTARLQQVFPTGVASPVPDCLSEFTVIDVDGKKLKHLPKRLLPTRKLKGQLFGGKLVVGMDQRTGLTLAMEGVLDGETNDAPLVPGLLEQLRQRVPGLRLYVEDRQFCDLVQPGLLKEDEYFLTRYHKKVSFQRDTSKRIRNGKDAAGLRYREEWGWLGQPDDPRRCYVRRITLFRKDDEDVIVVTNLLDADAYPAVDLLEVYRHRWDIENLFQRVTEVFHLRELISSTPQATIFQAAYCFMLSNLVVTVRAYLAKSQDLQPEEISTYQLQYDVQRELIAWNEVLEMDSTLDVLGEVKTAGRLRQYLQRRLSQAWTDRWLKSRPSKHTPVEKKKYIRGGHTSVQRLLIKAKRAKQSS